MNLITQRHQRTRSLGEILLNAKSGFASGETSEDGIVQARMNNVTQNGRLDWTKVRRVPRPNKFNDSLLVRPGDILFNATNSPELVGKSALFTDFGEPVTFSNHFIRLRTDSTHVDCGFLSCWLQHRWQSGVFAGMCKQWVNQASISRDQLLALEVPLPPLDEQRRIAAILDQADDLRRKRRAALGFVGKLVWSTFSAMFGDPEQNPFGFPMIDFGDVITAGPTNGLYKPADAYGDGTRILRINNFYDGRVVDLPSLRRLRVSEKELTAFALQQGDIVINRVNSREYLGKSAIIPALDEPMVFESNMMRIGLRRDRIEPRFCIAMLQTAHIRKQIASRTKDAVNQSSINQTDVRSFSMPLPSLDLQRTFGARVAEIDKLEIAHRAHLAKLDALFASLQHRAFRGEL